jgi:hypothetical protein
MDETNLSAVVLRQFLLQTPVLLISLSGLIAASLFYRRAPSAALWSVAAFGLVLILCVVIAVGQPVFAGWQFSGMRALTYLLLLVRRPPGRAGNAPRVEGVPVGND